MRQYSIIFGILLLLSIIDFTLAAPIPAQEKRQTLTCADVPKDVMPVVEKRGGDDSLEKLTAYFEEWVDSAASSISPLGSGHEPISDAQTSSAPPRPMEPEHEPTSDAHTSFSPPPGLGHESTSDAQTSSSKTPGFEHDSASDAQALSSPPPGLEHGSMGDAQTSGPVRSTANPNPLVEPATPLSTEPSTYNPASVGPSSYTSTDYSSDEESVGTHATQVSYPTEWDYLLNPQNPDSPPPSLPPSPLPSPPLPPPQQNDFALGSDVQPPPPLDWHQNGFAHGDGVQLPQQNGFAHGDEEIQPPSPQQNGFAHGDEEIQPPSPQQNEIAHGQMDDAASTGSSTYHAPSLTSSGDVSTGTPPELESILAAYEEWLNMDEVGRQEFHMHQPDPPPPLQQDEFAHGPQVDDVQQPTLSQEHDVAHGSQAANVQTPQQNPISHGIQMDDVAPPGTSGHSPASTVYGSPETHGSLPGSPPHEYYWPGSLGYSRVHADQPNPLPSPQEGSGFLGIETGNEVPTGTSIHTPTSSEYGWDYGSLGTHGSQPELTPAEWDYWINPHDSAYLNMHSNPPSPPPGDDGAHGTQ